MFCDCGREREKERIFKLGSQVLYWEICDSCHHLGRLIVKGTCPFLKVFTCMVLSIAFPSSAAFDVILNLNICRTP